MNKFIEDNFFTIMIIIVLIVCGSMIYFTHKKYEQIDKLIDYAIENKIPIEVK